MGRSGGGGTLRRSQGGEKDWRSGLRPIRSNGHRDECGGSLIGVRGRREVGEPVACNRLPEGVVLTSPTSKKSTYRYRYLFPRVNGDTEIVTLECQ